MNVDEYLKDFSEDEKKKFWEDWNESDRIRKEFMVKYKLDHECCPVCGETSHMTTLMGYAFDSSNPNGYKDMNTCTCEKCGDNHPYHNRVPKK
jgi:hypothetical protein